MTPEEEHWPKKCIVAAFEDRRASDTSYEVWVTFSSWQAKS